MLTRGSQGATLFRSTQGAVGTAAKITVADTVGGGRLFAGRLAGQPDVAPRRGQEQHLPPGDGRWRGGMRKVGLCAPGTYR